MAIICEHKLQAYQHALSELALLHLGLKAVVRSSPEVGEIIMDGCIDPLTFGKQSDCTALNKGKEKRGR